MDSAGLRALQAPIKERYKADPKAGLITLNRQNNPVAWQAMPWISGGACAIVLARPNDEALRAKVAALLAKLAADPASGINRVIDKAGVAAMGGNGSADFFVDAPAPQPYGALR